MTYMKFYNAFKDFIVFSISDIHTVEPNFYRTRLNEWQNKGYIRKILRGYYIFTNQELNEYTLFMIANKIYNPSYISFESALSYYNFIPESVYSVTSAATMLTRAFNTPLANFRYNMIKKSMFFGYEIISDRNQKFKIASPEKALIDYLYINSHIKDTHDFEKLRLNTDVFNKLINIEKLYTFIEKTGQKNLQKRINNLKEYAHNA